MATISPVILCGGSGTRLWPLSRSEHPKQFHRIGGGEDRTFFQATVLRHVSPLFGRPWVLVHARHVELVQRQLQDIQQNAVILAEPEGRNTAAAMAVAALHAAAENPESLLLTLPSDHLMSPAFNEVVAGAMDAAAHGHIVTFGIEPTYPETGFGYILDGGGHHHFPQVRKVEKFIEKPNREVAAELVAARRSFWAAGIALFKAGTLIAEFEKHAPDILDGARRALAAGHEDDVCRYLDRDAYISCRSTSCEYAVIEKSDRLVLAPARVAWNDIGSWAAFYDVGEKCDRGNVALGDAMLVDTVNSYVRSSDRLVMVVGLSDVVVVDTPDALLVTNKSQSQSVKAAVELLGRESRHEMHAHKAQDTQWGLRTQLAKGEDFSIEQLDVRPDHSVEIGGGDVRRLVVSVVRGNGEIISPFSVEDLMVGGHYEFMLGERTRIVNTGRQPLRVVAMLANQPEAEHDKEFGGAQDDLLLNASAAIA